MAWWKRPKHGPGDVSPEERHEVPRGVWVKCLGCAEILTGSELRSNQGVCPRCQHHHPISALERLDLMLDPGSFRPLGQDIAPRDILRFKDSKRYRDRIKASQKKTGYKDAAVAGHGAVEGIPVVIGMLAFEYMGGSMGSVVGEVVTLVFEAALEARCGAIIATSSGGARMQEGILSLMQMAKSTAALSRLRDAGLPYLSILNHPTTGGVAASFSMLGDVNIAEPGALIGFAGPRVIEQTIRQKLPEGFQRAEYLLEHGMVDMIVPRHELRSRLGFLLRALGNKS